MEMKPPPNVRIAVDDVEKRRDDFLSYRSSHIGSSDIAAIAGLDKWKTPLDVWAEKTGRIPPKEDNDTLWYGRKLEPVVGELFTRRTGMEVVRPCQVWQSNLYPWASMSPDFMVLGAEGVLGLLETKAPRSYQKDQWAADQAPDSAHVQLMWQLGLSGYNRGWCGAIVGGSVHDSYFPEFAYDDAIFQQLLEMGRKFYEENIVKDIAPEPDSRDTKLLNSMFKPEEKTIDLPVEAEDLFMKWEELERVKKKTAKELKEIEEEAEKVKNGFKLLLGGASCGRLGSFECKIKAVPVKSYVVEAKTQYRFSAGLIKETTCS